jgi:hypothetical protein
MRITIQLPVNRDLTGLLWIEDLEDRCISGPFVVCGRASDTAAALHGNPSRDRLLPYGDTPLGTCRVLGLFPTGTGTVLPESEFGSHGALVLEPVAGEVALAEANGRFLFLIHGGAPRADGRLVSTNGSLRVLDGDMRRLATLLCDPKGTVCELLETPSLNDARFIWAEPGVGGCDPPPVRAQLAESEHVRVAAKLSRRRLIKTATASAGATALRGIFGAFPFFSYLTLPDEANAQEYGSGTHREMVDGMSIEVRNGHHLDHDNEGHLVEVPNTGNRAENPAPEPPARPEAPPTETPPAPREPREPHDVDHSTHEHETPNGPLPNPQSTTTPPAPTMPVPATPVPSTSPPSAPHSSPNTPSVTYELLGNAILPEAIQQRVARIANQFLRATGRRLQITSGFRTPAQQAKAMFDKIVGGENPFGNSQAFREILEVFNSAQAAHKTRLETEALMASAITSQLARGIVVSRHLTGRAFDTRTRDLSATEQAALERIMRMEGGKVIHEGVPPHIHCQF